MTKQSTESKGKRASALLALVAWVGALVFCSAECWLGQCHSEGSHDHHANSHSTSAEHHERGDDSPAKAPDKSGFCGSLNAIALTASHDWVTTPPLTPSWVLDSTLPSISVAAESCGSLLCRQAKRADEAFTPVVCTDPANRSLAPPLLG